jgi:NAD(P)-dependent dehydrogenase (short-subunit alcohol dehydrogenase family)
MASVLITGANRGIGLELARQYAADGWRVHACCRNPAGADALVAALKGHDALVHPLDVTDAAAIAALRATLEHEPIDVLINNAGIIGGQHQALGDIDYDVWEQTIRTNVFAPYRVAEALVDLVAAGERRIIANVSSLMGSIADNSSGGRYIYRSSKTALNMVVVNLAQDLAEQGITVLAFHPGWVKTDMGGPNATVTPHESAAGMRKVIAEAGLDQSGGFFNYDGRVLAW